MLVYQIFNQLMPEFMNHLHSESKSLASKAENKKATIIIMEVGLTHYPNGLLAFYFSFLGQI